jgi:hypothetical protein
VPDMTHPEHMEKQTMTEEVAAEFVRSAAYEAEEAPLACCVDGRYATGDRAAAAAPGADAGKMLEAFAALRDLGISIDDSLRAEILSAVVDSVGGPGKFRFHTDHHAAEALGDKPPVESVARGCGHVRLASEDPSSYHLSAEDMTAIFERLADLKSGEEVLHGAHAESAVLVVNDPKKGLAHQTDGKQAFVYHAGWDNARLHTLAQKLGEIGAIKAANVTAEQIEEMLISIAALQRNLTLAKLAKGLPIYEVDSAVTSVGVV